MAKLGERRRDSYATAGFLSHPILSMILAFVRCYWLVEKVKAEGLT
jgi:hypothetical protein